MTYGLGLLFKDGVVMIADTRTNAGVDHVCIFETLHIFQTPGERVMAIPWAGTLSLTQTMLPDHAARPCCETMLPDHPVDPDRRPLEPGDLRDGDVAALRQPVPLRPADRRALKKAYDELRPGLIKAGAPGGATLYGGDP